MRWFMMLPLGFLFLWMSGCATTSHDDYETAYFDHYSWQREFAYDNDGVLSDFEILDLSPETANHLDDDVEIIQDDLKELFLH